MNLYGPWTKLHQVLWQEVCAKGLDISWQLVIFNLFMLTKESKRMLRIFGNLIQDIVYSIYIGNFSEVEVVIWRIGVTLARHKCS